jgi:phosphate transport system protein
VGPGRPKAPTSSFRHLRATLSSHPRHRFPHSGSPETASPDVLVRLAREAQDLLRRALDCFSEADADAARAVLEGDDEVDDSEAEVVRLELAEIADHPERASQAVDMILIAKNLERVGDHATNIAEDVILMAEARNVKHADKLRR